MTYRWLVGILTGVMLSGSAPSIGVMAAQQKSAAVPTGEVVLGPAGVPHRFENLGPGRLQTVDIHHSPRWIQTDLD